MKKPHGRFGVFCVRAYERDNKPISTHHKYEAAEARAAKEQRAFAKQLGVQGALISYEVFEYHEGKWLGDAALSFHRFK